MWLYGLHWNHLVKWNISYSTMDSWQIPCREILRFSCCWMMIPLRHTQSHKSTCSIRSWQSAGLTAKRPPMCHHHSLCFMLSCLPQSLSAPCLISRLASGLHRFILLPPLVFFFGHTIFHFAAFHCHYSFLFSHSAVRVLNFRFFGTWNCFLSFFKRDSWTQLSSFSTWASFSATVTLWDGFHYFKS